MGATVLLVNLFEGMRSFIFVGFDGLLYQQYRMSEVLEILDFRSIRPFLQFLSSAAPVTVVTASWLESVKTSNPWVVEYPCAMNLKGRNNTPRPGSESSNEARKTGSQLEEVFRGR